MKVRGIGAQLLDLLFPPRCQLCRDFCDDPLCKTCRRDALFITGPRCPCCGRPMRDGGPETLPGALCADCRDGRWLSGARSAGLHVGTLRRAMITYKFNGRTRLVEPFAEMLVDLFNDEVVGAGPGLPLEHCQALVPVPLHPKRRNWRGFDQAELLCERVGEALGMPVWTDALVRIRDTRPQTQMPGASRRANVRGAFEARSPQRLRRRSFILVDDVMTTGATLEECARVLKTAGAAGVYALSVTRAAPRWHPVVRGDGDRARAEDAADA